MYFNKNCKSIFHRGHNAYISTNYINTIASPLKPGLWSGFFRPENTLKIYGLMGVQNRIPAS